MPKADLGRQFEFLPSDPLAAEHQAIIDWVEDADNAPSRAYWLDVELKSYESGRVLLNAKPEQARLYVLAALAQAQFLSDRMAVVLLTTTSSLNRGNLHHNQEWRGFSSLRRPTVTAISTLMRRAIPFDRDDLITLLKFCNSTVEYDLDPSGNWSNTVWRLQFCVCGHLPGGHVVKALQRYAATAEIDEELKTLVTEYAKRLSGSWDQKEKRCATELEQLTGNVPQIQLVPCEYWSVAVNTHISARAPAQREKWYALLKHALAATSARPSERWRRTAGELISKLGAKNLREALAEWLPLVSKGRSEAITPAFRGDPRGGADLIHDENANALRGLLWLIPMLPGREELTRLVTAVALSAYKKVPGIGPRAVKVGNAAVYCLSQIVSPEAMGQLAILKVRVRFGTAQKEVEKAFDAAAAAMKLPRDQVEEMSVPACGLEEVGLREEVLGSYRAQLAVTGSKAELRWFDAQGKQLKSMPAAVKQENAEIVKELQSDLKLIQPMLSAQRDRIDGLFLAQKSWAVRVWRERYIDHPLVGTIARRLIWIAGDTPVLAVDGAVTDMNGKAVELTEDAEIRLWHPVERSVEEVLALRRRIEALGIVQPFKQAHREVYLLTDAELRTASYSNRFAAHIVRQHQFNALCGARQWRNKLRLLVDDEYPPATRELPNWNLRAEFWIEGVGDDYGQDTNEAGVFLRLVTDQVRFYRTNAAINKAHAGGGGYTTRAGGPGDENVNEPVELEEIPALVFSEVMRDMDLFVGVASVGNDPTWQDGGPQGRFVEYWRSYSFGELSATAVSRREILEGLIPRLKIAKQCSLADKFLVVKGSRRTYKIHLGSGNILMEPNDQYLCIVPDSHARMRNDQVYLPFEGDATLSIILSKAFLLSEDEKIKDSTINRQIDGR
ncbi:MAG TPA: DUF4132 domain-containing protein [Terracidiphilus sp.]|nr:DUF4132 domain-containing protein [Terracidiphilus sp.]